MNNEQLIEYIKQQLRSGFTKEVIKSQLVLQNYQPAEIDAAFASLTETNSSSISPQTGTKKSMFRSPAVYIGGISLLFILYGLLMFVIFYHSTHGISSSSSKNQASIPTVAMNYKTPTKMQIALVTPTTIVSSNNSSDTNVFISKAGGYRFNYLKSWKANAQNIFTATLTAPGNQKATDIEVYPLTYETDPEAGSHEQQIKGWLAVRGIKVSGRISATNPSPESSTPITPVNFGGLPGFEAPTLFYDAQNGNTLTDNIFLQGKKQMYIFTFRDETSPKNFDAGRLLILKSFTEL